MISVRSTSGLALRQKVISLVEEDSSIPTFANSTSKLNIMMNDPNVSFNKLSKVVEADPTLAASCIKIASSAFYGRGRIDSVSAALSRIGMKEVRRLSTMRGVLDTFRHYKVSINWNVFMSHTLLTARLTEYLCHGYSRKPLIGGGTEHLAGLLHDIGRVFLAQHFPQEFEAMLLRSVARGSNVVQMEVEMLGISHAEIGMLMCKKWNLNQDVLHAIRHHHEPSALSVMNGDNFDTAHVLALCLCAANGMANCYGEKFAGSQVVNENHEQLPEWTVLSKLDPVREVQFDITNEISTVSELVTTLLAA